MNLRSARARDVKSRGRCKKDKSGCWMKKRREFSSRTRAESSSHLDFNSSAAYQVLARVVVSLGCMTWLDSTSQLELFAHISSFRVATMDDSSLLILKGPYSEHPMRWYHSYTYYAREQETWKKTWENSQKKNRHNKKAGTAVSMASSVSFLLLHSDVSSWLKFVCAVWRRQSAWAVDSFKINISIRLHLGSMCALSRVWLVSKAKKKVLVFWADFAFNSIRWLKIDY